MSYLVKVKALNDSHSFTKHKHIIIYLVCDENTHFQSIIFILSFLSYIYEGYDNWSAVYLQVMVHLLVMEPHQARPLTVLQQDRYHTGLRAGHLLLEATVNLVRHHSVAAGVANLKDFNFEVKCSNYKKLLQIEQLPCIKQYVLE